MWTVHRIQPSEEKPGKIAVFFRCSESGATACRLYDNQKHAAAQIPIELGLLGIETERVNAACEALRQEFLRPAVAEDVTC